MGRRRRRHTRSGVSAETQRHNEQIEWQIAEAVALRPALAGHHGAASCQLEGCVAYAELRQVRISESDQYTMTTVEMSPPDDWVPDAEREGGYLIPPRRRWWHRLMFWRR